MRFIPKTMIGKVGLSVVVALIATVALMLGGGGSQDENGILVNIFLVFMGAIIALQVVPGVMLFGAMIKGLSTLGRKEAVKDDLK